MKKLLNKPWFVALLAAAAVLLMAQALLDSVQRPGYSAGPGAVSETSPEETAEPAQVAPQTLRDALAALSLPESITDPFLPRATVSRPEDAADAPPPDEQVTETIRLAAIWQQDGEVLLLINGRICRAGESVGRLTIETATLEGIWLTHWKGRDFLPLGNTFTLVTPTRPGAAQSPVPHES